MTTDSKTRGFRNGGLGRGLAVLGLLVAGGVIPGCIVETSSGPPPVCLDSALSFTWFVTAAGVPAACPAGSLVTVRVDDDTMIADFPCTDGQGSTLATLVGGTRHFVDFYLQSGNRTWSSLENIAVDVGCGVTQPVPDVEFSLTTP
jgi:hypothetical protein